MGIEEELRTYLRVLWRYKWMIAACALMASMVALGISFALTPRYSATATLRLASAPLGDYDYAYISSLTRLSNTFVEIASSDASLDEIADLLGLDERPKVEVSVVPETELITLSASHPDPGLARDIANALADLMVEKGVQLYGSDAPTAQQILEDQLSQAKADLDAAVAAYDAALRNLATTPDSADRETPTGSAELGTLERLVSVRQQMYGELLQRYENTRISEQVRANALTIVEPATLPDRPSTPNVPLNAALGLFAGLAMAVILAFLFEGMDDTLRGIEDVQAVTTLPILCQIPERKRRLAPPVAPMLSRDNGLLPMPAFHQLRARLTLSDARESTTFLIASAEPNAGKSTVAAHLAMSLAEAGHRVMLVDMDFRRPSLHSILSLPNGRGLSDYMCGTSELEAAVQDAPYPNLRVATAGSSPHVPPEWLAPAKVDSLLETLAKECDYVLIDSPALLSVADPTVLASQADAVILVVARHGTGRKHLRFALQQLAELKARVAGIVLNKVANSQMYSYYA
ncbi:MAG: polysaccharide biosynthesis tyrosine autokinase, partial [Anaerolineae bacterium]